MFFKIFPFKIIFFIDYLKLFFFKKFLKILNLLQLNFINSEVIELEESEANYLQSISTRLILFVSKHKFKTEKEFKNIMGLINLSEDKKNILY